MSEQELIVLRRDLIQALRSLQDAARGKTPPDLLLYSEPGRLLLSVGDLKTRIPAEGTLPGMAYISGLLVKILPKMIPVSSEISITRVEDRIAFGKNRIGCRWEDSPLEGIPPSPREDLLAALCLRESYSLGEIEGMGKRQLYEAALHERDRRITEAHQLLDVFGVSRRDLNDLVELTIRRLCRENPENYSK